MKLLAESIRSKALPAVIPTRAPKAKIDFPFADGESVTAWIDDVTVFLSRQEEEGAKVCAESLLANLKKLLTPVVEQAADDPDAVRFPADILGFGVSAIRDLEASSLRGLEQIARGNQKEALQRFKDARKNWLAIVGRLRPTDQEGKPFLD